MFRPLYCLGCFPATIVSQLVSARFGDGEGGGKVDARALLVALGLEQAENAATGPTPASVPDRRGGNRWTATTTASASRLSGSGSGPFQEKKAPAAAGGATGWANPGWRSSSSGMKRQGAEPSPPNRMDEQGNLDLDVGADLESPTIETSPPPAYKYRVDGNPPAYEDILMQSSGIEERAPTDEESGPPSTIDGDENEGVREPADHSVGGGGAGGGFREEDASTARGSAATVVEEENARLRSELAVFDVGFFEEVEDLKYSYATLKREAEKLAKKQGVDLAASLGLPEDGEEPWDRSVDMAHHSVDWAETARRRPPGSPSSPPRGAHAARLARRWNKLSSALDGEEEDESEGDAGGFPLGSPTRRNAVLTPGGGRFASDLSAQRSRRGGSEASAAPPWNGLVAAHERKLAWELSTGGMGSLACLREHVGRVVRLMDGFGSDEEVLSALRQSGYPLELEDVAVLRTGLGSSADGKVDLEEFMTVCEDIASGEEWYVPAAPAIGVAALAPAVAMLMRSPENWNGAASRMDGLPPADMSFQEGRGAGRGGGMGGGFASPAHLLRDEANCRLGTSVGGVSPLSASASAGLAGAEPLYLGGTLYGDRSFLAPSKSAEGVLAELKDQLKLLDMDRFFPQPDPSRSGTSSGRAVGGRDAGGGAVTLGRAFGAKFSRRDPSQSGLLSARELGLALEDVGVSLHPEEVVTLARKFKPPGENQQVVGAGRASRQSGTPSTTVVADDGGGLDGVVAEYAPLVRLVVDCLADAGGIDPAVGGRARLGQRGMKWNERMPAPAKRLKATLSAGAGAGVGGWLERLRQRFVLLMFVLLGLPRFRQLRRCAAVVAVCGDDALRWFVLLAVLMSIAAPCAEPPPVVASRLIVSDVAANWVVVFVRRRHTRGIYRHGAAFSYLHTQLPNPKTCRFRDFDIDGDGCLGRREFMRALNLALACETGNDSDPSPDFTVGGLMSKQEATELMGRLDRDRDGRVYWEAFVEYFAGVGGSGGVGGGGPPETWFQREEEIAEKLLQHMEVQGGLAARRSWVNSLRRRFQTADAHGIGALDRYYVKYHFLPFSLLSSVVLFFLSFPVTEAWKCRCNLTKHKK